MSDCTQKSAEVPGGSATPVSLRDDLEVLDAYAEAFLDEVNRQMDQYEMRGTPPDFRSYDFRLRVLDAAFPERTLEALRGLKALALAPTIFTYRALLAGERVPWNRLDYMQAMRYGLRRRSKDPRVCLDDFNDVPTP